MAGRKYGLDLGTNYVKIYNNTRKNILVEHNMIAIRKKKEVIACGDDAYEILPMWNLWENCLTTC